MEKKNEWQVIGRRFGELADKHSDGDVKESSYIVMANISKATSRIGKDPEGDNMAITLKEYIIDSTEPASKEREALIEIADNAISFAKRISHEESEIKR